MRLIYFAPVPWSSYWQRPHFMVEHLLRAGVRDAVWVDPYPTRLPVPADLRRLAAAGSARLHRSERAGRTAHDSRMTHDERVRVISPAALPIEPLPGGAAINRLLMWPPALRALTALAAEHACLVGIGRPSALACWALHALAHHTSFYDAMDDFPAFYRGVSARAMARAERQIASRVSAVFCSAPSLRAKLAGCRPDAQLVPNGYAMRGLPPPRTGGDGIGYVGTIGGWFDWPLVLELARALPHETIRLTGPQFVARPPVLPANIELHPECSRTEAVERLARCRIGLIPFRCDELTRSVDPVKYYEYRALGLPVWSTAFGTMTNRCDGRSTYRIAHGIDWQALHADTLAAPLDERDTLAFRAANDWSVRFATVAERVLSPGASPMAAR